MSLDWILLIFFLVMALGAGLYYLNKWASNKMATQNQMINAMKQQQTLYIIDKKRDKIQNIQGLPKMVAEQIPSYNKVMKMNFVKAKVGPQIITFMCDKHIYDNLPTKKNVKCEIAGIYIVNAQGIKSKEEMKAIAKDKKKKAKEAKKMK